jgi:hypothetical protein
MTQPQYPFHATKPHANTPFRQKWGVSSYELAAEEGVTLALLHMRVMKFGTPYQRRAKPTKYEKIYSRTCFEICEEQDQHQCTIGSKHNRGNAFEPYGKNHSGNVITNHRSVKHWRDVAQQETAGTQSPWLHPRHPDYHAWRDGTLFPKDYVGGSRLTTAEVEAMMREQGWKRYQ